jgi:hypothetical protein
VRKGRNTTSKHSVGFFLRLRTAQIGPKWYIFSCSFLICTFPVQIMNVVWFRLLEKTNNACFHFLSQNVEKLFYFSIISSVTVQPFVEPISQSRPYQTFVRQHDELQHLAVKLKERQSYLMMSCLQKVSYALNRSNETNARCLLVCSEHLVSVSFSLDYVHVQ